MGDPISVFRERYSAADRPDAIKRDILQDLKYKPSKLVNDALEYYSDLVKNKQLRLFETADIIIDSLHGKLQSVTATSDLKEIKLAMELLGELAPLTDTIQKAKAAYLLSMKGGSGTSKGNISKRELPRDQR